MNDQPTGKNISLDTSKCTGLNSHEEDKQKIGKPQQISPHRVPGSYNEVNTVQKRSAVSDIPALARNRGDSGTNSTVKRSAMPAGKAAARV